MENMLTCIRTKSGFIKISNLRLLSPLKRVMDSAAEFVKYRECEACTTFTDVFCVSCEKWICLTCSNLCVQCEQRVCKECQVEDFCCLVRPWGKKTESQLRDFYQNKLVDTRLTFVLFSTSRPGDNYRNEAVKRTIAHYVENFDAVLLKRSEPACLRRFFPSITKYIQSEEMRLKFVALMEKLSNNRFAFAFPFLNEAARDDLFSVMDQKIRSSKQMQGELNLM